MQINCKEKEKRRLDFKIWATSRLMQRGLTRSALAIKLDVPVSRICEAINGTGNCKKYIPLIISELSTEEEKDLFQDLVEGTTD